MNFLRLLFVVSICGVQLNIYSQQKGFLQKALNNNIIFLDTYTSSDSCDYNIAFLSKYLAYKYHRNDFHFDLQNVPVRFEDNINVYNFYDPLIGLPSKQGDDSLNNRYKKTIGLDHLMLWGVHANKIHLDSIAKQVLFENAKLSANIRNLCHVAIAIHWAENKMNITDQKYILPYVDIYTHLLTKALKNKRTVDDDFMEGLVGIICLKKKKLIKPQWIKMIIKSQNHDGGWAWGYPDNIISHPHTTILAYWILLELTN